jgi:predicted PurR-regulated permease PerM
VSAEPKGTTTPDWLPDVLHLGGRRLFFVLVGSVITVLSLRWLVHELSSFISTIIMALFLSFALEPAAQWFVNRGWRRGRATGLIMVLLLGVCIVLLALIVPAIINGSQRLIDSGPELVDRLASWLKPLGIDLTTPNLINELRNNADKVIAAAQNIGGGLVLGVASSILGGLFRIATIALFTYYFVAQGPQLRRVILSRMPPERQERLLFVWEEAIRQTGGYFYSRLLLAFINGTGMYFALRLNNVPFAAPLAIFEGIVAEFIPIVGTYIGGALPLLVAFLTSITAGLWAGGYILVYQQLENYFLSPRLTAKTMSLHPAVAFAAALIGGALGGLAAAFLALPVAGVIQAAITEYSHSYDVVADTPDAVEVAVEAVEDATKGKDPDKDDAP